MAKGPRGERRPADVIGNAVHVMRIRFVRSGLFSLRQSHRRFARIVFGMCAYH
jgi:hypothetical protein